MLHLFKKNSFILCQIITIKGEFTDPNICLKSSENILSEISTLYNLIFSESYQITNLCWKRISLKNIVKLIQNDFSISFGYMKITTAMHVFNFQIIDLIHKGVLITRRSCTFLRVLRLRALIMGDLSKEILILRCP